MQAMHKVERFQDVAHPLALLFATLQAALDDILGQMADWPPMQCLLQVGCTLQRCRAVPGPRTSGAALQPSSDCNVQAQPGGRPAALLPYSAMRALDPPDPLAAPSQGDVGCGKTAVAFLALLAAAGAGYQGAIMVGGKLLACKQPRLEVATPYTWVCWFGPARFACTSARQHHACRWACNTPLQAPTEILAEQHYRGLQALVQRINRQATRRRLSGFQLPRIALVGRAAPAGCPAGGQAACAALKPLLWGASLVVQPAPARPRLAAEATLHPRLASPSNPPMPLPQPACGAPAPWSQCCLHPCVELSCLVPIHVPR